MSQQQQDFEAFLGASNPKLLEKIKTLKDEDGSAVPFEDYHEWSEVVWMKVLGDISGGTIHSKLRKFKQASKNKGLVDNK